MFIDPLERKQDDVCTLVKVKNLRRWQGLDISDLENAFKDTFGFCADILKSGSYPGTIFWFPLRQKKSPVSDIVYSESEVSILLESFITEADRSVLFAKTISKIEVYVDTPTSTVVEHGPRETACKRDEAIGKLNQNSFGKDIATYSVEIDNIADTIVKNRTDLNELLAALGRNVPNTSQHWTDDAYITSERKIKYGDVQKSRSRWLIVNYLKGGQLSKRIRELLKDDDLCYHHIVGLAARVEENEDVNTERENGHVFCNQPLPRENRNRTGLPVHVNAFFALGNNRREVKWEDRESSVKQTDKAIEWNHALVYEILPDGYYALLQELVRLSGKRCNPNYLVQSVYNAIPDLDAVDLRWKTMAEIFMDKAAKEGQILFSNISDGQWIGMDKAVMWSQNMIPTLSDSCRNTVRMLLSKAEIDLVTLPEHVVASLKKVSDVIHTFTPDYLSNHMQSDQSYRNVSLQQKEDLMQFLAADRSFRRLNNLELLPLADRSFTCFNGNSKIFMEPEEIVNLFPGMGSAFVSIELQTMSADLIQHAIGKGELFNLIIGTRTRCIYLYIEKRCNVSGVGVKSG